MDVTSRGEVSHPITEQREKVRMVPEMFGLVELTSAQLEAIVRKVPGGAANVQDIYPLTPLQEGMLFHHVLNEGGDGYVLSTVFLFDSHERVDEFVAALSKVIERHDILRTAVMWEHLARPVQVVYRHAQLAVERIEWHPGQNAQALIDAKMSLQAWHMDLGVAPLMRLLLVEEVDLGAWRGLLQIHHLLCDYSSLKTIVAEVMSVVTSRAGDLQRVIPFRAHVEAMLADNNLEEAERFFRGKLSDIDEPSTPFGIADVHGSASDLTEAQRMLEPTLVRQLREQADRYGTTASRLLHASWALVVAHTVGRDQVAFGVVLRVRRSARTPGSVGLFVNTLPLRLRLDGVSARVLVEQIIQELQALTSCEQVPLAVAQRYSSIEGAAPLFSSLFNYRPRSREPEPEWAEVYGIKVLPGREARTNYPITVTIDDLGASLSVLVQTDARLDPNRIAGYMRRASQSLVEALEKAPESLALDLPFLEEAELRAIGGLREADSSQPQGAWLIHEIFERQAKVSPDSVAVVHGELSITYAELNDRANRFGRWLRALGVGPDGLVGLCMERSIDMVAVLLGVLKAGAAYVPLDPHYPSERLRYMIEDAGLTVLLTQQELMPQLSSVEVRIETIGTTITCIDSYDSANLVASETGVTAENLAYVIYTSGSTGLPKGTAMPHRPLVNLLNWHRATLGCTNQRALQFAALSFDVAFQEIFSTLCDGGTLVLIEEQLRKDPGALLQFLNRYSVQRLFIPPVALRTLAEHSQVTGVVPIALLDVITAGEQLRITPDIVRFFEKLRSCRLHNHYGPTETHVVTTLTLPQGPDEWPTLPTIGRPIGNTQIHILDRCLRPTPIGATGEIFIGGANVSRGYLRHPEMTHRRYLADPVSSVPGALLYRTGDLGRYTPAGTIQYLGRSDHQIKIRGFRVEPGEIEARLAQCEGVGDAVVIARQDVAGGNRLVAYVTPDSKPLEVKQLRELLKSTLPNHMVPSAFIVLETLPLTPTGKLDRRALPAPQLGVCEDGSYEALVGSTEEAVAAIWCELLNVERVGRNDNFFTLGGHSLLVMQMIVRLADKLDAFLSVQSVMRAPLLRELARLVEQALKEPPMSWCTEEESV